MLEYDLPELKRPKKNYIDILADSYYLLNKGMENDLAFACGSVTLSSCCPNVRIPTSRGLPLSLDEMDIVIGVSGAIKTIPLKMLQKVMEKLGLMIPTFPTTEGCATYFAEKNDNGEFLHKPFGCIVEDELSGKFKQQKVKSHMAGNIELYSKLYDHKLDDEYLAGVKYRFPQRPYINVIGATINHFLPQLPDNFFAQGLAGRFNWVNISVENMKFNENDNITDTSNYYKAIDHFKKHIPKLRQLLIKCSNMGQTIKLRIEEDVNRIFMRFDKDIFKEWKYQAVENPFGWDYQYLKRLSEMAIKQAGRYCIGRNFDYILEHGFDNNVYIIDEDMALGINRMRISDRHLRELFRLRRQGIFEMKVYKEVPPYMRQHTPQRLLDILKQAPNEMLNNGQWHELSNISSPNDFTRLKNILLDKQLVKMVDKSTIKDESEIRRLRIDRPATKVYKVVK